MSDWLKQQIINNDYKECQRLSNQITKLTYEYQQALERLQDNCEQFGMNASIN